jgi:hypothetical protein
VTTQAELDRSTRLSKSDTCPVEGCGKTIRRSMLMCGPHWREVPPPLKREVYASARRLFNDGYRRWRADALAAIEAVEDR